VVLRRRDGVRQATQPELFQTGQKTFMLLTAKHPEHEFGSLGGASPRHNG